MRINKKAVIGSVMSTFFAIIVIIVILIVFALSASFVKDVSNGVMIRAPDYSAAIERYMSSFRDSFLVRAPGQKDQGGCCDISKGEFLSEGICKCNAAKGYEGLISPAAYLPPCVYVADSTQRHVMSDSLVLTDKNKNDEGFCIFYYSQRYLAVIQKEHPDFPIIGELAQYGANPAGYIERVLKESMTNLGRYYPGMIVSRETCYKYSASDKAIAFGIFYNSWVDNVKQGNTDDLGYCATFNSDGQAAQISFILRSECLLRQNYDSTQKYSFFVETKGSNPYKQRDARVDLWFTENRVISKDRIQLTEEEVKMKCDFWQDYDLTYIMGYRDSTGVYDPSQKSTTCLREQAYLRQNIQTYKNMAAFVPKKIDEIPGERFCCYMNK